MPVIHVLPVELLWENAPGVVANRVAQEACVQVAREASKWNSELAIASVVKYVKT